MATVARSEIARHRTPSLCPDEEWIDYETSFGRIVYGPQYTDDQFVYRHIRVSHRLFREISRRAAERPSRLLTNEEITKQLGIQMSPDWQHVFTHTRAQELLFKRNRRDAPCSSQLKT